MKRKSRKEILYEEAALLFKEKGYPASSVRELADRVGIEASSIYSHVKSKEELLVKICMDTAHYFADGMDEVISSAAEPIEKITRLIELHMMSVRVLPASITVFTDEWKHLPEPSKTEFVSIRNRYQEQWIQILKEGMVAGNIVDSDPYVMRDVVLSSLRWVHYLTGQEKNTKINLIASQIKDILFNGISR